jgi:hypothetical protein
MDVTENMKIKITKHPLHKGHDAVITKIWNINGQVWYDVKVSDETFRVGSWNIKFEPLN